MFYISRITKDGHQIAFRSEAFETAAEWMICNRLTSMPSVMRDGSTGKRLCLREVVEQYGAIKLGGPLNEAENFIYGWEPHRFFQPPLYRYEPASA